MASVGSYLKEIGSAIFPFRIEKRQSPANVDEFLAQIWGNTSRTDSGINVTEASALNFSAVYAAVAVISETLASLPHILYRRTGGNARERATDHKLFTLLHDRPNPEMTPFTFYETLTAHLVTWGNLYAEIERNRLGEPIALWPLLPDRTIVERKDGVKRYRTRVNQKEFILADRNVFHVPGLGWDGLRGYSVIRMHRQAIGLGQAAESFGARLFGSGLSPHGVIETPIGHKFADNQTREDFRKQLEAVHGGLDNASRLAILQAGMKWIQTSIPPDDAQFLETRRFQVTEIARIFRIPPHRIGDLTNATFTNIEHQSLEFIMYTMRPWLVRWEQTVRAKLVSPADQRTLFSEFLIDGLLRGDSEARAKFYASARQNGWMNANEIRARENMNPIGDQGEVYTVQLNLQSLDELTPGNGNDGDAGDRALTFREIEALPPVDVLPELRSSHTSRRRVQNVWKKTFSSRAQRVIDGEVKDIRAELDVSDNITQFRAFVNVHYGRDSGFGEDIRAKMEPIFMAFGEQIHIEAAQDFDADEDFEQAGEEFMRQYTGSFVQRWLGSSRGQLLKVMDEANDADYIEAVAGRVTEWTDKRAGKVAAREVIQAGNAITVMTWTNAGATNLRWRTLGDNCPLCDTLNGKVVDIKRSFLSPGDVVNAGDGKTSSLKITNVMKHPPLHEGCDCTVEPG